MSEKFKSATLSKKLMIIALAIAFSWGSTVFTLWLISLCFRVTFDILVATGIWLVIWFVRSVLKDIFSKSRD